MDHPIQKPVGITEVEGGARFTVYVQPRAKKNQISGVHGEAIKVRVAAPPIDGAADKALTAFIAKRLGVRKSVVRILRGETSRQKVIEVEGVTVQTVTARLLAEGEE